MTAPRHLIIADGDFGPMTSKTANSIIRYHPERTVAVLDREHAGRTVQDVLGFGGAIPVVASMREGLALGPTAVLIGIAPKGGQLPTEWRAWLGEALDAGCDIWNGLHNFLADDPTLAAKATGQGPHAPRSPPAAGGPPDRLGAGQGRGSLRRAHGRDRLQRREDDRAASAHPRSSTNAGSGRASCPPARPAS